MRSNISIELYMYHPNRSFAEVRSLLDFQDLANAHIWVKPHDGKQSLAKRGGSNDLYTHRLQ